MYNKNLEQQKHFERPYIHTSNKNIVQLSLSAWISFRIAGE